VRGVLDTLLDARAGGSLSEGFIGPAERAARSRLRQMGRKPGTVKSSSTPKVSSSSDFEKKHPRGRTGTTQGGKFVAKGTSGEQVRAVQSKVGAKRDGQFGPHTERAVKSFQRRHGLQVDGVVGHQTALALAGKYKRARNAKVGHLRDSDRSNLKQLRKDARAANAARRSSRPQRARGGTLV
jgi:murein L,D-transpeptidase YcbB/YkuD